MELSDLIQLVRDHFNILAEPQDKPYWVRFIASPYNAFVEGCRAIRVTAHNRGTRISPYGIKSVLQKFEVTEDRFRDAYNAFFSQAKNNPTPSDQPTAKPN